MPQMSPMNWVILFVAFILLMMIVMNKTYFLTQKKDSIKNELIESKKTNIKWMW